MSTRGVYGFILEGKEITTYNHGDSYAVGLGNNILSFINNHSVAEMKELAKNMKVIEHGYKFSSEERKRGFDVEMVEIKKLIEKFDMNAKLDSDNPLILYLNGNVIAAMRINLAREKNVSTDEITKKDMVDYYIVVLKEIWSGDNVANDRLTYTVELLFCFGMMEYMSADLTDVWHDWIYLIDLDTERLKIYTSWCKEYENRKDTEDTTRIKVFDLSLSEIPDTFGETRNPNDGDRLKNKWGSRIK